jgi:glyoxylase I family protein
MMFKRIDHVEIVTDQLERTAQFYTEVLGFTVKAQDRIERSGLGVPIDLVYLDLGGTVVELISYGGVNVDPAPKKEHLGYRMIALEVDDMQKTTDYLRTKGVDIVWGPRVRETYSQGGDLRPQRLPHRAQGVVPLSRCSVGLRSRVLSPRGGPSTMGASKKRG